MEQKEKAKTRARHPSPTIQEIEVGKLKEYDNNPRRNDQAVPAVAESIKEFGFKVPIVIDKNNVIVAGHTRLKAARLIGLKKVPCIIADDLTPEQVKAFRIADNKTAELAEWDFNALEALLFELRNEYEMGKFGFETEKVNADEFNEDFSLPDTDKPIARTITMTLTEKQFEIVTKCIDWIEANVDELHDFGNADKKSNAVFEGVYQWAEQKNLS